MGLPAINIAFKTTAADFAVRTEKGIVALILRDTKNLGGHVVLQKNAIPKELGLDNQAYVERAFLGYVNPPKKVLLYVIDSGEDSNETIDTALEYLETQQFDYLAGPPDISVEEAQKIASWIKTQRGDYHRIYKAVLPNCTANSEGIVNFTTSSCTVNGATYTAAQMCSRIAGLIAGTPMRIACTFAPLPEILDCTRLSAADMDEAIEKGQFILYHDGEKVKVGRGVNSLTTLSETQNAQFQKIKFIEAIDMMQYDLRRLCEDTYIGKYPNDYDNKCVLLTAIGDYLKGVENAGILKKGSSEVTINLEATEQYLASKGVDTSGYSEQDLKNADTGDKVFLTVATKVLDAIEDISINITV